MESGKVLTPMGEGGKKGQMTMLVGLGTMLAYRVKAQGNEAANDADLDLLVQAAQKTLNHDVNGNFSGPFKRQLMREFGKAFLTGLSGEYHEGLPVHLLKLLTAGAFAVAALPKPPKAPKARKKVLPDVDGPVTAEPQVAAWEDNKDLEEDEAVPRLSAMANCA